MCASGKARKHSKLLNSARVRIKSASPERGAEGVQKGYVTKVLSLFICCRNHIVASVSGCSEQLMFRTCECFSGGFELVYLFEESYCLHV